MAETAFLVAHGIPKDGESKVENAYSVLQHASSPAAMLLLALNQIFDGDSRHRYSLYLT